MMKNLVILLAVLCVQAFLSLARADGPPRVVATIKPIHSLVAAVMQGVGEPRLLIAGGASPHTYQLKPSDARALQNADVIFWVGEDLERFLEKPLASLPKTARVIRLAAAPGVMLLGSRESGASNAQVYPQHRQGVNDRDTHHDRGSRHRGSDMHIWLDVGNARAIVNAAADALVSADAGRAELYRDNRRQVEARLTALDHWLQSELTPVAGRPYIVLHDAYHYLEHSYGLTAVGWITVHPERQPSARRVAEIRQLIVDSNAVCIFGEPQFEPALVKTVSEGTRTRIGVLDADGGIGVAPGPDAYFTLMRDLGVALKTCLSPAG